MKTVLLGLWTLLACAGCGPGGNFPIGKWPASPYQPQPVRPVYYGDKATYNGQLVAVSQINVGFTVPGRVLHLKAKEGTRVAKGDLLALLDPSTLQEAVEKANLLQDQARDDFGRAEQLYNKGHLPKQEYLRAKFRQEQAAADYRAARRQVMETWLSAPEDGLVVSCAIAPGSVVTPGSPCIRMIPERALYADFIVPAADLDQVCVGRLCYVNIPDARMAFSDTVDAVLPQPDAAMEGYTVRMLLPYTGNMKPGMAVEVSVSNQTERCFAVPLGSLTRCSDAREAVRVLRGGAIRCMPIEVLELEADEAIVRSRLEDSDLVLTDASTSFSNTLP